MACLAAMCFAVTAQPRDPALVRVDSGELQGTLDDGVVAFKGEFKFWNLTSADHVKV